MYVKFLFFLKNAFLLFNILSYPAWKSFFLHPRNITEVDFYLVDTMNKGEQMSLTI